MTDSAPQGFVDLMIEKGAVKDGPQIVGTLRSARRLSASEDLRGPCLHGQVYGDTKGRFRDGDWITTSTIVEELAGGVFRTRYSAYRVESWGVEAANDNQPRGTAADINAFVALTHGASAAAGWWNDPTTGEDLRTNPYVIGTKIGLIHSEVSEAMEGHRKGANDDHLPHRKSIEVELADAMIRIGDMAGVLGLDLGGAIVEKMAYNAQRADHKTANRAAVGGKAY